MSNSIWKKPTVRPVKDCIVVWQNPAHMSFTLPRTARKYMERYNCERWTTLDDLIAQADKAERLQKAVDNSREKLAAFMHDVWGNWFAYQLNNSTVENLQRWGIQSNLPYSSLTESDKDKDRKFADRIIEIIKSEIKQLIKGTTNDK